MEAYIYFCTFSHTSDVPIHENLNMFSDDKCMPIHIQSWYFALTYNCHFQRGVEQ